MIEGYEWVHWTLFSGGVIGLWYCFVRMAKYLMGQARKGDDE